MNKKIGKDIRRIREEKNISSLKLAELSGVSQTYITAFERGEMNISIDKLNQLCKGLDCTLSVVISD